MFSFGNPHATLQQFDCSARDFESLLKLLPDEENPFLNWNEKTKLFQPTKNIVSSQDVATWFPKDNRPVFHTPHNGDRTCSQLPSLWYSDLHKWIHLCHPYHQYGTSTTVAVVLPSTMMAEMAVVLVSLLAQPNVCVAPLDPNMPQTKLREALLQLHCQAIVTTRDLWNVMKLESIADDHYFYDIRLVEATGGKVGAIRWTVLHQEEALLADETLLEKDEERPVILLRTSGTTSVPKVVPLTASSLLYNATCLAASLQLKRNDVGCNTMPLFHIGGVSCALLSVLVSGSSVVMMGPFNPETFLDCINTNSKQDKTAAAPTWYYGVPSMHRALTLTAQARLQQQPQENDFIPNNLRFIRSGAAPLPHNTAAELSKVFHTEVIPTYSMSESMPICSSHKAPVISSKEAKFKKNMVGHPIGCSLRIVDEQGNPILYGREGEIALRGPGVMVAYHDVDKNESHTPDDWLRTGDIGILDTNGDLKLKGRLKEMIKRGGDQVWPNEIDRVVEAVPGVSTAITFSVPNDLWGEEVAVAVVMDSNNDEVTMKRLILDGCKAKLDKPAVPCQIVFVPSTKSLLRGPTGKYLRNQLANHLKVNPIDTGALRVLEGRVQTPDYDQQLTSKQEVIPSSALNGVRFIAACFVVQGHIGVYPNSAWVKISLFSLNMQIFFLLGGFQLACSIKNSVLKNWAEWVGTKIGTMHALFVVTQLIALPAYLLFQCGPDGYKETFEEQTCQDSWKSFVPMFIINTATAMVPREDAVNPPAWFQTAFYMFLMLFPPLDAHLRKLPVRGLVWRLVVNLAIATLFFVFVHFWLLEYLVLGWLPTLVSAMIAGYFFSRYAVETANDATTFFQNPRVQGVITDLLSILFLVFEVLTATSPDCVHVKEMDFIEMRPGEELPEDSIFDEYANTTYVYACDVTYDEWFEYVGSEPDHMYYGRWPTPYAIVLGWGRVGTPLVLLWLYAMAHGSGFTARLLNAKFFQVLSPLAYPLYLLHIPIARYYWLATRGLQAEAWWYDSHIPVEWYETFIIIAISLCLGSILDRFVVSFLSRYTVWLGVKICQKVSMCFCCCSGYCHNPTSSGAITQKTNLEHVKDMVERITGNSNVTRSTNLNDLGLDSLGATALLGTLRVSVPLARQLALKQLIMFQTVGDLVDALDTFQNHDDKEENRSEEATMTDTQEVATAV